MNKRCFFLLVILLIGEIISSCSSIRLEGYVTIKASEIDEVEQNVHNECLDTTRYYYTNTKESLDGKFRIKYKGGNYCFAEVNSGLLTNEYRQYFRKKLLVKEYYNQGIRNGESTHYTDIFMVPDSLPKTGAVTVNYMDGELNGIYTFKEDTVVKKTGSYSFGVKNGLECWLDQSGDTLKTINFIYDQNVKSPNYLKSIKQSKNYNFVGKVQILGLITTDTERRLFFTDLVGIYSSCSSKEMILVEDLFENKFLALYKQDVLTEIIKL